MSQAQHSLETATAALQAQPKWTRLPIRTRPHRNPLAENDDDHPDCPEEMRNRTRQWYPTSTKDVEFLDVGCAFGGMLFSLAPLFPDTLMLGLEIRPKVVDYAQKKTIAYRGGAGGDGVTHHFGNLWFEPLNVMKFGSNCFEKGQLSKIFFCYPDPHWKRKNIRRRIISPGLVQEYAFWLRPGGLIYTVSDVEGLETWMISCLDACPLFRRLSDEEISSQCSNHDDIVKIVIDSSEDAQRTARKGLKKNYAVHVRIEPNLAESV
ncbi:tRNA guanine-N(7)-methyltransferase, putative [Bodo saltans]|uniref:tRNA (guanine-N(7)-)-methyltransferase n=1 Tax=Bodo saltans TaxID=75058 RepID=A0A0S4JLN4_BODSA|nr:tRNA guanine-N(7)-methyltransferase, putative [Bodo saltans]|eukprot:CUG92448.1 tRNA guanine-N(7)-methyltransferase, putative [Bodo saltans]